MMAAQMGTMIQGSSAKPAVNFFPANDVQLNQLITAARLSSLADETPEGRSIVELADAKGVEGPDLAGLRNSYSEIAIVEFTASTRVSGLEVDGRLIRKGAASAVGNFVTDAGGHLPAEVQFRVATPGI